jgi:hypothetical protein
MKVIHIPLVIFNQIFSFICYTLTCVVKNVKVSVCLVNCWTMNVWQVGGICSSSCLDLSTT